MIQDFLGITVVGALLSAVISGLRSKFGTEGTTTKIMTIILSIAVGGAYFLWRDTSWWMTMLGVLAASQTVYAMLIKK